MKDLTARYGHEIPDDAFRYSWSRYFLSAAHRDAHAIYVTRNEVVGDEKSASIAVTKKGAQEP